MTTTPKQSTEWAGQFGNEYTERNTFTPAQLDELYTKKYGITRSELNEEFVGSLSRDARILEVGCGAGNQLLALQDMGFTNLYGVELNAEAVELSKKRSEGINVIQGSAFDIPFRDGFFDVVFTSGVLIHIEPSQLEAVMRNVYRCSRGFIWGFEYFSPHSVEVDYRGRRDMLWKSNFTNHYLETFGDLVLFNERKVDYLDDNNADTMFMLWKGRR